MTDKIPFHNDPLFRNWFEVVVAEEHYPHDVWTSKSDLSPELIVWLANNARLPYRIEFTTAFAASRDGSATNRGFCRVMFRASRDATLFKMFWGASDA